MMGAIIKTITGKRNVLIQGQTYSGEVLMELGFHVVPSHFYRIDDISRLSNYVKDSVACTEIVPLPTNFEYH